MLVEYSRKGAWTVGIATGGHVLFKNGENNIGDDDWAKVKDHPVVKKHMDSGVLAVAGGAQGQDTFTKHMHKIPNKKRK